MKTGDKLSLGKKELVFIEAPMLHWPDTMMEYLTGDAILFSNDAFGQHIASEHIFNDLVAQSELFEEAIKYYANILTPFSPLVTKKINELRSVSASLSTPSARATASSGATTPCRSSTSTSSGRTATRRTRQPSCTTRCGTAREGLPRP